MEELRNTVEDFLLKSSRSEGIESYVNFELNHLELHEMDDYLFQCFLKGLIDEENKTNSNIKYLLGMTDSIRDGPVETVGGSWPD